MKKSILSVSAAAVLLVSGSALAQISPQLPAPGWAPAGSPVAVHGALKVGLSDGKGAILDKSGNPVILRGMSLFWANAGDGGPYFNDNVVGWLAHDFRVSVVRAPIGADATGGGGGTGYADGRKDDMLRMANAVIEACIRRGVYVIADWHVHNTSYSNQAIDFFKNIGQKYGKYPNVIFEPFNEPLEGVGAGTIKSFVDPLVVEIRKHSDGLVVVGSGTWSQNPNDFSGSNKITDSKNNTAYSFHFYTNTHGYDGYGSKVSSALSSGLAVLVTEFGTVNANGDGQHNATGTNSWLTALEGWKVGWINWSVTHKAEGASILSATGTGGGPWSLKENGTYIKGKITGSNGSAYSNWLKTYPVNVTVAEGSGTVKKQIGTAVNNGPYNYGDAVSIIAVPDAGWQLDRWEGDAAGWSDTLKYTVKGGELNIKVFFGPASLIKNGTFERAITDWTAQSTGVTLAQEDGTLKVTVTGASAAVRQFDVKLEKGKKYKLSFRAKASGGNVSVTPRMTNRTGAVSYWEGAPAALTPAWAPVEREFPMCADNDATARFWLQTNNASGAVYNIDDIMLDESGTASPGDCQTTAVLPPAAKAQRTAWSVSRVGGTLQLRGPVEAGAKASLYDVRGKAIRSIAAVDGLTLGAGVPAGSYMLVVRNGKGGEVYRTRVVMAR